MHPSGAAAWLLHSPAGPAQSSDQICLTSPHSADGTGVSKYFSAVAFFQDAAGTVVPNRRLKKKEARMSGRMAAGLLAMAFAATGGPALAEERAPLDWIVGAWVTTTGEGWTEEWWTPARGGLMLGASRSGSGPRLREFEHTRIVAGADGKLTYQAQPGGNPAVSFAEESRSATTITFVNPNHDYPQRISYRREGDTLTATISLLDGGNSMSWRYRQR